MTATFYRQEWSQLVSGPFDRQQITRLSRQVAHCFLDTYLKNCRYEKDYVQLLCEMSTFSRDSSLNSIPARALFQIIIESLCDDFEALQTETYNRVMAEVITYCRRIPAGAQLNRRLEEFGLFDLEDLRKRSRKIRTNNQCLSPRRNVEKILLLSRVTIGADVAITSIIIQRLAKLFPGAEIILIGGARTDEIYGGNPRVTLREVNYNRKGGLLERLSSWNLVLQIIQQETSGCAGQDVILIDPDSRLSQLGVLPLSDPGRYFFFDSRSDAAFHLKMSMAELTNAWLDKLTGEQDFCHPKVWLPHSDVDQAARRCQKLRVNGTRKIIAVNFGVGGNRRKRVGRRLEEKLLLALLQEPGTLLLLDKGYGPAERAQAEALMAAVGKEGYPVAHTAFDFDTGSTFCRGLLGVETRIGEIAALIDQSDEYIGYDSACQHIAAAVRTPCLTIFAGSNNMRFIRRWSAYGPASCRIVHVDTLSNPGALDIDDIVTRVMNQRKAVQTSKV